VVGEHVGLSFYTLGQRKGIGVGGMKAYKNPDGSSDAWYVARKDMAEQHAVHRPGPRPSVAAVAAAARRPGQLGRRRGAAPRRRRRGVRAAKTRYRQADVRCCATSPRRRIIDSSRRLGRRPSSRWSAARWRFDAITAVGGDAGARPSAVLYDGDVCLGGGIIDDVGAGVDNDRF
jgi:tRNA-specific 2-thiouridylase